MFAYMTFLYVFFLLFYYVVLTIEHLLNFNVYFDFYCSIIATFDKNFNLEGSIGSNF